MFAAKIKKKIYYDLVLDFDLLTLETHILIRCHVANSSKFENPISTRN